MKAISENIYERGKHGIKYVRRRIPIALRAAYPSKHIVRSLGRSEVDPAGQWEELAYRQDCSPA
ncbi:MAG: hypothetical protein WA129_00660 [Acidovorax sp.]